MDVPKSAVGGSKGTQSKTITGITSTEVPEVRKVNGSQPINKVNYSEEVPPKIPIEESAEVFEEIKRIKRIDEIKVEFIYNSKYNETEFARQLADQQKGMNELTVQEYLDNRQAYVEQGRAIEGNAAQQAARENAYLDKVEELRKSGLSVEDAKNQANEWMNSQAALHNPDQVAGGNASNVGGVGDRGVNSSIGAQWRYRIDAVDEQIQQLAVGMTEIERNSTYLNVNLTYKGE